MKQFRCEDVHLGCDARFTAASEVELLRHVTRHGWERHDLHLPHLSASNVREVLSLVETVPDGRAPVPTPRSERVLDVDVQGAGTVSR